MNSLNWIAQLPMRKTLLLTLVGFGLMLSRLTNPDLPSPAQAAPNIFASPVHAGCYLAKLDRCKIHVEPFTINIASGQKLVQFDLVTTRARDRHQTMIYDFRPDQSNPVPASGTTFTPSLVAKDFAATCGESYMVSLQGKDTGDSSLFNLGVTGQFTCPIGTYLRYLPLIDR